MRLVSSRFYALLLCLAQAPALIGSRAQGHSYLGATAFQRAARANSIMAEHADGERGVVERALAHIDVHRLDVRPRRSAGPRPREPR